jgi:hypothetical protein
MNEKNKYIYVNGCSYTYGIGIETSEIRDKRWSTLVAREFNVEVTNSSCPGSSNFRIARHTYQDILTASTLPEIAIIMWSDGPRQEFFRPQENEYDWLDMAQITPQGAGGIKSFFHKDAFESFFSFINSEERALMHTIQHMLSVEMLFKGFNIPVLHLHFKSNTNRHFRHLNEKYYNNKSRPVINALSYINNSVNFLEKTNPYAFGFNKDESFGKLMHDNQLPLSTIALGHPEHTCHSAMADWIIKLIRGNDDLIKRM